MAGKISKTQGEELLRLVDELKFSEVFELLDNYGFSDVVINTLKEEFMLGHAKADFTKRLKVYVGSITDNSLIETEYDIFFSFSSKNRAEAEPIVKLLRECELLVFFSDADLQKHAGTLFIDKISEALHTSKHFLLYCTPEAMQAEWVKYEYKTFITNAYIPSGGKRHLFILQGSNFSTSLLTKENLFKGIQQSENITNILEILGKTLPKNDLAERKDKYKGLFVLFFETNKKINEKHRKELVNRQKELKLSDGEVAEIEMQVENEFTEIETVNVIETVTTKPNIIETATNKPNVIETVTTKPNVIETAINENKTKFRNYAVIAAVTLALLLGSAYGVDKWNENNEKEKARLAKIAKQKQDSIRIQDSINNVIAQHKKDSLNKIIETQKLQNNLQAKKIKDSLDFIANIKWQDLEDFKEKGKYGFCDKKTKKVIIPAQYNGAGIFFEGLAAVKKGKLWGFIDKTGKEVLKPQYDHIEFFSEGLAAVKKRNLWGFIDKTRKEVIKLQYENDNSFGVFFSEDLAAVKKGNLWGFIDKTGKEIIKRQYDDAYSFYKGLAVVRKNGKTFYINTKGKFVKDY
jgi:hypothetical protein